MLVLLQCGDRSLVLDVANYHDLRAQAEGLFQQLIDGDKELDLSYAFPAAEAAAIGLAVPPPTSALLGSPSRYGTPAESFYASAAGCSYANISSSSGNNLNTSSAISPTRGGGGGSGSTYSSAPPDTFTAYVRCPQSFNTFIGVWQECVRPRLVEEQQQLLPTLTVEQGPRMSVPPSAGRSQQHHNNNYSSSSTPSSPLRLRTTDSYTPAMDTSNSNNNYSRGGRVVAEGAAGVIYESEGASYSGAGSGSASAVTRNKAARPSNNSAGRSSNMNDYDAVGYGDTSYDVGRADASPQQSRGGPSAADSNSALDMEAVRRQNRAAIASVLSPSKLNSVASTPGGGGGWRGYEDVYVSPPNDAPFPPPQRPVAVSSTASSRQAVGGNATRMKTARPTRGGGGYDDGEEEDAYHEDANGTASSNPPYVYSQSDGVGPDGLTANQRTAKALLASFSGTLGQPMRERPLDEQTLTVRAVMRCGEASVLVPFDPRSPPSQRDLLEAVRRSMVQKLRATEAELSARSPSRVRRGGGGNNYNDGPLTGDELFEAAALEALSVADPSAVVFVLGMALPSAPHSIADVDDDSDVRLLARAMLAEGNSYAVHLVVESRAADDVEALALPNAFFFGEDIRPAWSNSTLGFNRTQASPSRGASRTGSDFDGEEYYDDDEEDA